jgi:hypothetical protein
MDLAYDVNTDFGLLVGGGGRLLSAQIVGLLAIIAWTIAFMGPMYVGLHCCGQLRVRAKDEKRGLDFHQHGGVTQLEENRRLAVANKVCLMISNNAKTRVYMYACMYVCMYLCVYVCLYTLFDLSVSPLQNNTATKPNCLDQRDGTYRWKRSMTP